MEAAIAPSGSPVYFVDQSTDAVIYTVSQASQLNLQIYGEADDDFWVETTSGNIVVNDNGSQIANDWELAPSYGGTGWTLFRTVNESESSGVTSKWYLLRSTMPAVQALGSAPVTSKFLTNTAYRVVPDDASRCPLP